MKSVKSINPFKSVIQTIYNIAKTHSGQIKIQTNENEETTFTLPNYVIQAGIVLPA